MNEMEQNYDEIPMTEVLQRIKELSGNLQDNHNIMEMATVLGIHMCKLQKEFGYPPIFPIELMPLPKLVFKKWGFSYALLAVKKQRMLKQYQQDAAVYFTRFREMTKDQWAAIKTNSIENLVLYNADLRDKKTSTLNISIEYKTLIDNYRSEYDAEVNELHSFLNAAKPSGCMLAMFLIITIIITFINLLN